MKDKKQLKRQIRVFKVQLQAFKEKLISHGFEKFVL